MTHAVQGNDWDGSSIHKYTLFEYYPIDHSGRDTSGSDPHSTTFDPSGCRKIREARPANYGTGTNPEMFVCTPVEGAINLEHTIEFI